LLLADEQGTLIDGDQLLATIASYWQEREQLSNNGVVATVMSNLGLEKFLTDKNISLVRTQVGDRYVGEAMRAGGYNVGGENSGHIILSDYSATGDGIISALQVLSLIKQKQKPASEVCSQFEAVPQVIKNITLENKREVLAKEKVQSLIKEAEASLNGGTTPARLLVRPSGTEPLIRIMAEGENFDRLNEIVGNLAQAIEAQS
jgi:phosphoglucosamine mutase